MKILYVTTISNTVNAFLISQIRFLVEQGHQVDVAFHTVQVVSTEISSLGCRVFEMPFQRSPIHKGNLAAYQSLKDLIHNEQYDVVHTHTPVASVCVRIACRKQKNTQVWYTAHGFHFYKGAPFLNWMVFYPIEKWLSRYTDILFTINKEDYERAIRKFHARKTVRLPGIGFHYEKFAHTRIDREKKREEIGVPGDSFLLLSVGELNKNKNQSVVIRAMRRLKNQHLYYVLCGIGEMESNLRDLAKIHGVEERVLFLGYRDDINEILQCSDVFIFPSFREGLGLAALEAMASGLPIITSNVHGIADYSVDTVTGFSCSPKDDEAFSEAIKKLYTDRSLCLEMGERNRECAVQYDHMISLASFSKSIKKT